MAADQLLLVPSGGTSRRTWVTGVGISAGLHLAVAGAALAYASWQPVRHDSPALPAMAIEIAPAPAAPVTPQHDTPPQPKPIPKPVSPQPKDPLPDILKVAAAKDPMVVKATPKPASETPPPPPPAPPPAPPAVPAKAAAPAAPSVGQPTVGETTAQQTWEGKVLAKLESKKRFPAEAARAKLSDVIYVRLTIDRSGHILSSSIVRSKHFAALDEATRDLVKRSDPLPALPEEMTGNQYTFTVPVDFYVKSR